MVIENIADQFGIPCLVQSADYSQGMASLIFRNEEVRTQMSSVRSKGEDRDELAALVKEVQKKKSEHAMEALVLKTQSRFVRICFHLVGSKAKAEDLAQDSYLKAFCNIKDLKDPKTFYGWLCRIARNTWIDQSRTAEHKIRKLEKHASAHATEDEQSEIVSSIEDKTSGNVEQMLSLQQTLNRLDPDDRMIILLAHHEQMSTSEVADALGISEGAVRMRLTRARREFFEVYEKIEREAS